MGSSSRNIVCSKIVMWTLLVIACSIAVVSLAPVEDTQEVKEAKATFMAAFKAAAAGEHSSLAPEPVKFVFQEDAEDVKKAKADFVKAFKAVSAAAKQKPFLVMAAAQPFHPHQAVTSGLNYATYPGKVGGFYAEYPGKVGGLYAAYPGKVGELYGAYPGRVGGLYAAYPGKVGGWHGAYPGRGAGAGWYGTGQTFYG